MLIMDPKTTTMTEDTGEQVAQTGSRVVRDAIDLSETPLRPDPSGNGRTSASREALELSKLSAEREKIEPEVAQLREGAADAAELRRKIEIEKEKNELELQKLRDDVGNARWARYFEFAKAFVPAGTIIASVWVRLSASSTNATRIDPLKFRNNLFTSKIRLPQHTIRLTNQTSPSSEMPLRPF